MIRDDAASVPLRGFTAAITLYINFFNKRLCRKSFHCHLDDTERRVSADLIRMYREGGKDRIWPTEPESQLIATASV